MEGEEVQMSRKWRRRLRSLRWLAEDLFWFVVELVVLILYYRIAFP